MPFLHIPVFLVNLFCDWVCGNGTAVVGHVGLVANSVEPHICELDVGCDPVADEALEVLDGVAQLHLLQAAHSPTTLFQNFLEQLIFHFVLNLVNQVVGIGLVVLVEFDD